MIPTEIYKLTVYMRTQESLLPVHIYYSEDKGDLLGRASYHESFNESYVSILITYQAHNVEIV